MAAITSRENALLTLAGVWVWPCTFINNCTREKVGHSLLNDCRHSCLLRNLDTKDHCFLEKRYLNTFPGIYTFKIDTKGNSFCFMEVT
jgi:hypothetical protein